MALGGWLMGGGEDYVCLSTIPPLFFDACMFVCLFVKTLCTVHKRYGPLAYYCGPEEAFQIPLPSRFLLFLMPFRGLPQAGSRAGPGPRRGGITEDHAGGPCEGGRPRGRPGLSRAPARTPQSPMRHPLEVGWGASGRPRMGGTGCVVLGCVVLAGEGL